MLQKKKFTSTLVAMKVPSRKLKRVVQIINSYPQVTHNYLRNHSYNLWFTLKEINRRRLLKILNEIKRKYLLLVTSKEPQSLSPSMLQNKLMELPARKLFKLKVESYHRQTPVNCLAVWQVPKNKIYRIGRMMAKIPEVSHCFERLSQPSWPYNLYTMIHTHSKKECEHIVKHILQLGHINNYQLLYTLKKYKRGVVNFYERGRTKRPV